MSSFAGILGNELIKEQFKKGIEEGHLKHTYMLAGEKGIGKKTMAEAFLLELFCQDKTEDGMPCLNCPECKKVLSGNHPDIIYITPKNGLSIRVDDIREQLVDTVEVRPFSSRYKVYVITDAELMNEAAQNAMLKTLEEPPEYVIILLLANDERKLLDTVRSRVIIEKMKPLTDSAIRQYLKEHFDVDEEKAEICTAFSRGILGRAIELYTSEEFSDWYQRLMKIIRNIKSMSSVDINIEVAKLRSSCPDIFEALDLLELWYRDLTMYMVTRDLNGLVFFGETKALMNMASKSSHSGVQEIMNRIEICRNRLKANVNPELSLELLFMSMKEM